MKKETRYTQKKKKKKKTSQTSKTYRKVGKCKPQPMQSNVVVVRRLQKHRVHALWKVGQRCPQRPLQDGVLGRDDAPGRLHGDGQDGERGVEDTRCVHRVDVLDGVCQVDRHTSRRGWCFCCRAAAGLWCRRRCNLTLLKLCAVGSVAADRIRHGGRCEDGQRHQQQVDYGLSRHRHHGLLVLV